MSVLKKSLTVAVLTLPMFAFANDGAVKNFNKLMTSTKSMTANFSQTTKAGGKTQKFSGSMAVQRGNQFRWETKAPAEQLIVANGQTMWIYDKDLQQATKQSVSGQMGDTPAILLSGDATQIGNNFTITQPDGGKNYYVLKPKSTNATFKDLSISFNGGKPVMMVMNDNMGQTTTIKFSNITMNKKLNTSQFSFTPPANVDVIEQ